MVKPGTSHLIHHDHRRRRDRRCDLDGIACLDAGRHGNEHEPARCAGLKLITSGDACRDRDVEHAQLVRR